MPVIWTIGYEQATVAGVMAALNRAGVDLLADVRALPLSRRPGFSKSALAANAREAGIEYRHFKALGTPADGRAAARRHDHATLERIYAAQLDLPEAVLAGVQLTELALERKVALLCYERAASECHRTLLRKAVLPDFEVVDLLPDEAG
ncbi:DUF488 family protein [Novosphingobium sp. EMRT-2]|uniref:DUF488 domain-containing protein n=1 Tax=Novosphingobium sp. EMRT-2 TaxID=2571749 RepID=UPI0010BD13B3|nr:DUF488 domain-containing protein [Novosphingobium sp. EMRT-2]QCI92504.1 DUF488 domain-containing protein [Novosphingobium sp. EMRT-2]